MILSLYQALTQFAEPLLRFLLKKRIAHGKEDAARINERMGRPALPRPSGKLVWVHAASVGEAQSALILIHALLRACPSIHVMVTTGTVTSARMMEKNLPEQNAFHQFYPLDNPDWVWSFLTHWKPDIALWMESELWPNMLLTLQNRGIPIVLINARLSDKSFKRWKFFKNTSTKILSTFHTICSQTNKDTNRFVSIGAHHVITTGNLKYSAAPLPFKEESLKALQGQILRRRVWLYASTHKGEETLAARMHTRLKVAYPDLLTIIVPRHPSRRNDIQQSLSDTGLTLTFRGENQTLPTSDTDIYIADTMGELGLFYRLAPVTCIGRSFSDDGGGGHNPIEAAQLNCAILYGPHVQYQQELFDEISDAGGALQIGTEQEFFTCLFNLLSDEQKLRDMQEKALRFIHEKETVAQTVLTALQPALKQAKIIP